MYFEQESSDEDIYAPIEIQLDRVTPISWNLRKNAFNDFDSIPPKYFFDGGFIFAIRLNFSFLGISFHGGGFLYK